MASYKLFWKESVRKDLRRIHPEHVSGLIKDVEALVQDPFPGQARKLQGSRSTVRLRSGVYRIIYQISCDQKEIVITHIAHRKDIYR